MLRTFSTGSPHSYVQFTQMQLPYMLIPWSQTCDPGVEPGTYLCGQEGERGKRCTKHAFSQNMSCLTNYTHICMQNQLAGECPQKYAYCQL